MMECYNRGVQFGIGVMCVVQMRELSLAIMLVLVGFAMVIFGKQVLQFIGIILMSLSIGGGVMADLKK